MVGVHEVRMNGSVERGVETDDSVRDSPALYNKTRKIVAISSACKYAHPNIGSRFLSKSLLGGFTLVGVEKAPRAKFRHAIE